MFWWYRLILVSYGALCREEEERLRKKREEEAKKREALLLKQQEMMRYDSQAGKPNYVIQKKSGGNANSENQDGENSKSHGQFICDAPSSILV